MTGIDKTDVRNAKRKNRKSSQRNKDGKKQDFDKKSKKNELWQVNSGTGSLQPVTQSALPSNGSKKKSENQKSVQAKKQTDTSNHSKGDIEKDGEKESLNESKINQFNDMIPFQIDVNFDDAPRPQPHSSKRARQKMRALENQFGNVSQQSDTKNLTDNRFLSPSQSPVKRTLQKRYTKKPFSLGIRKPSERQSSHEFARKSSEKSNDTLHSRTTSLQSPRNSFQNSTDSDTSFQKSNPFSPRHPRYTQSWKGRGEKQNGINLRHTIHDPSTQQNRLFRGRGMHKHEGQSFRSHAGPGGRGSRKSRDNNYRDQSMGYSAHSSNSFIGSSTGRGSVTNRNAPGRGESSRNPRRSSWKGAGSQRESFSQGSRHRAKSLDHIPSNRDVEDHAPPRNTASRRKHLKNSKSGKKMVAKESNFEMPHKSITLVWAVVAAELCFDFATTIIAYKALTKEAKCCGIDIKVGHLRLAVYPFICLIVCELALLARAIVLTIRPQWQNTECECAKELANSSIFWKWSCCCLKWPVKMIMAILGLLVILNPFCGCLLAWILMYQSDKDEAFVVLGLECGSLVLHFISVWLEGAVKTFRNFLIQLIPTIPVFSSIGLTVFYLKQGGICYSVEREHFGFQGCELCDDGYPPWEGLCYYPNGTAYPMITTNIFDIDNLNDFDSLTLRTVQTGYCQEDHPLGPPLSFCFYAYE